MADYPYVEISKFLGMDTTRNKLSIPYYDLGGNKIAVKLGSNRNFLYLSTGGLEKRGGGDLLTTAPSSAGIVYGLGNYQNNSGIQYLVTVKGTKVYAYTSGWVDLGLALTNNKVMRFEGAGFDVNRALYGFNGYDSVVKVYMSLGSPTAAFVASSPTDCVGGRLHKNRLFAWDGKDTLRWTDVNAFDTWNTGTNYAYVFPGKDGYIQTVEVWGDALFIFKERGVYVLPNAADSPSDWKFLRTDALTGTQSPDSCKATKIGIMFLATDNYIRLISPNISFSSAEYTLAGSGAPIVSHAIQEDFIELLDSTNKQRAAAVSFNDLYILSFQTVNNSSTYNDKTFFADTSKTMQMPNVDSLQPFWGEFTGFDYDYYATQSSSTTLKLYGAKGAVDGSIDGRVQETLSPTVNNDAGSAIQASAIMSWIPPGGDGIYKKFKQIYFAGDTENWYINLVFNSYKLGGLLPGDGEGVQKTFNTSDVSGIGTVGTGVVGTAVVGQTGISSTKYRLSLKGHYFKAEFSNMNANEFVRINKMIVYYRPIKSR